MTNRRQTSFEDFLLYPTVKGEFRLDQFIYEEWRRAESLVKRSTLCVLESFFLDRERSQAKRLAKKFLKAVDQDESLHSLYKWGSLSNTQKQKVVKRSGEVISCLLTGTPPNKFSFRSLTDKNGYFSWPHNDTINIAATEITLGHHLVNKDIKSLFSSLAHESAHYRQYLLCHNVVANPKRYRPIVKRIKHEAEFYISSEKDLAGYQNQLMERHARLVGDIMASKISTTLKRRSFLAAPIRQKKQIVLQKIKLLNASIALTYTHLAQKLPQPIVINKPLFLDSLYPK